MAEVDGQEKSEQPSEKKLRDGRDKGQVAKSIEINSLVVFSSGLMLIFFAKDYISGKVSGFSIKTFSGLAVTNVDKKFASGYFVELWVTFFSIISPVLIALFIASFIANVSQVGFNFSFKALAPKLSKFSIIKNVKRIFFSSRSFVEIAKSLMKLGVIGFFTYNILFELSIKSTVLTELALTEILSFMVDAAYSLIWRIILVFAIIAAIDLGYQKFKFKKDMMMTKQELKEENKSSEGDPLVKSRIKKVQFSMSRNRMMQDVKKADIVITNPTHFAVALKYDMQMDNAPKVVAKGADEVAKRIKKIAVENGIPLHEDKELARALYKLCETGDVIPQALFKAVAKILAYMFQVKNIKKKKSII